MLREIGLIGLGDMGSKIAERLQESGYSLVLYNRSQKKYAGFAGRSNVRLSNNLDEFVSMLRKGDGEIVVWSMLPGGDVTNTMMLELSSKLRKHDIIIDASNSVYDDSIKNARIFGEKSIFYLDVGLAGGPSDVLRGVALMVGGDRGAYSKVEDLFKTLSGTCAYGYLGSSGSGHMAKLVHNVIFYGINPVYVEGAELLQKLKDDFNGSFDVLEAFRLYSFAPPINGEIIGAIATVVKTGEMPIEAPEIKVSNMITWAIERASRAGVSMKATNAVLSNYSNLSEKSRRIYSAAKKIVTGHY
jgi:6-phosphogluconate dehydrogenase